MTGTTERSKKLPPPIPAAAEVDCVSQIYHDGIILLPRTINCCIAQCQGSWGKICGKLRTDRPRHLLLPALLLASLVMARAAQAGEGTATVPRFEAVQCPKLQGAETL